jgi:beta-glucosidase
MKVDEADSSQVGVIGPNAKIATYCGGGSASLLPYYAVTPFDGILAKAQSVRYSVGCYSHQMLPLLGPNLKTSGGEVGVIFKAFTDPVEVKDRQAVDVIHLVDTNMYLVDYYHPKLTENLYWAEVEGFYTPDEDGDYEFGLTVFGTGKLYIDEELLIDNETVQRSGGSFFNVGTVEETGVKSLKAGITYQVKVTFASGVTSKLADADGVVSFGGGGIRIGGARVINAKAEIEKAVELAKAVQDIVLCVGLNVSKEILKFRCRMLTRCSKTGNKKGLIESSWIFLATRTILFRPSQTQTPMLSSFCSQERL